MLLRRVMKLNEFKVYFAKMNQPWYFAKPDDTDKLLREIGYINTGVHLHNDRVILTNRKIYAKFVKTVIMKPFWNAFLMMKYEIDIWNYFCMKLKREIIVVGN